MKTEKEKMIKGEYYHPNDHTLMADRAKARQLTFAYQQTNEASQRKAILKELLGACGEDVVFEGRIQCDYGYNIEVGEHFFANFDAVLLDVCKITIGDHCLLGPNVHIYTAGHPLNPEERQRCDNRRSCCHCIRIRCDKRCSVKCDCWRESCKNLKTFKGMKI